MDGGHFSLGENAYSEGSVVICGPDRFVLHTHLSLPTASKRLISRVPVLPWKFDERLDGRRQGSNLCGRLGRWTRRNRSPFILTKG